MNAMGYVNLGKGGTFLLLPPGYEGPVPGKGYFTVLRLYGPTAAAIDKRWKLGDIEKAQ